MFCNIDIVEGGHFLESIAKDLDLFYSASRIFVINDELFINEQPKWIEKKNATQF